MAYRTIRKNQLSAKEWLTFRERLTVARNDALDHGLLGEMRENPITKQLRAGERGFRRGDGGRDGVGHGRNVARHEQRVRESIKDLRNTTNVGSDDRDSGRRSFD